MVQARVYNALGQEQLTSTYAQSAGTQQVTLLKNIKLAAGIYMVHLQTENGISVQKLVVE
jgi:hypothetical protein